jgi:hypothetical protein
MMICGGCGCGLLPPLDILPAGGATLMLLVPPPPVEITLLEPPLGAGGGGAGCVQVGGAGNGELVTQPVVGVMVCEAVALGEAVSQKMAVRVMSVSPSVGLAVIVSPSVAGGVGVVKARAARLPMPITHRAASSSIPPQPSTSGMSFARRGGI